MHICVETARTGSRGEHWPDIFMQISETIPQIISRESGGLYTGGIPAPAWL